VNVHAGYGMFYDNMRTLQNFGELTWPQARTIIIQNPSYPDPLQGQSRDAFISSAPPNITVYSNTLVNPYAHQFAGGVTRQLTGDFAITADVTSVWRYSDRDDIDINLPDQSTRVRPFPQFARVTFGGPTSNNYYKALLLKLDKRMSHHFQALASYTLAKADDSALRNAVADVYGFTRVDSASLADRRHRLVTSGIVALPYDTQVSAILDLRSDLPFNPQTTLDINQDGYVNDTPPGVAFRSGCRDLSLDSINKFRSTRNLAPVTDVACPGFANLDLRLSKFFRINDYRVEFIAQLFNVANRANFNTPIVNPASATFGTVNQLLPNINAPSRQAEFAVRFQF
jgi:hypothetical protein